ncbi:MAG: DUF6460 domain-containing protein [Pseudomonadota bacterium]
MANDEKSGGTDAPRGNRSGAGRTIIQLVIASIFVGAIFSFLGLGALDFWEGVFKGIRNVVSTLGESFGEIIVNLITYLLIGGAIVIPIWLIARILTSRRS